MTPIDFEKKLQDYLDGELSADEAAAFEAWLERHPEERALLERTRAVKEAAAALPREVAPARDLWPGIRARLREAGDAEGVTELASGPALHKAREQPDRADIGGETATRSEQGVVPLASRRPARPYWLGALAATLLAAAVLVTLQLYPGGETGGDGQGDRPDAGVTDPALTGPADAAAVPAALPAATDVFDPELAAAEAEFLQATEDLLALLEARKDRLPPQALATVEQNLRLVNAAIDEIHAALAADPGNPAHGHALAAMYKRRMQLLWIATELSRET